MSVSVCVAESLRRALESVSSTALSLCVVKGEAWEWEPRHLSFGGVTQWSSPDVEPLPLRLVLVPWPPLSSHFTSRGLAVVDCSASFSGSLEESSDLPPPRGIGAF